MCGVVPEAQGVGVMFRTVAGDILLQKCRIYCHRNPYTRRKRRLLGAERGARNPHLCILFLRDVKSGRGEGKANE